MPEPNRLPKIAEDRGEPLEVLIPRLLARTGSIYKVAVELGVYPNTIRNWMKTNGVRLESRPVVVRDSEARNG